MELIVATTYSISELSKEFDITTRTIRFYEEKGVLSPKRQGTRRIFSVADRLRLALILKGRRLGFSIEEARRIMHACEHEAVPVKQLQEWLQNIEGQQALLKQQLDDIAELQIELRAAEKRCHDAMGAATGGKKARGHQLSLLEL